MNQLVIPGTEHLVTRKGWTPPRPGDFAHGLVQAFDQSLNNTGVILLRSSARGINLLATDMLRPPEHIRDTRSYEGNNARADYLYISLLRARQGMAAEADAIVYERPPVRGHRTESIMMAGREVHRACEGQAHLVDNRHAKAILVGRAGSRENPVTKNDVKAAVERYIIPPQEQGKIMPWNEHTRDAAMLALTWLYDEKKRQEAA